MAGFVKKLQVEFMKFESLMQNIMNPVLWNA